MPNPQSLEQFYRVDGRFRRSINIAADYQRGGVLTGYLVTPLTQAVLSRIGLGLEKGARSRAWSITGPYGAGKSACAVFLCQVLGYPINEAARQLLQQEAPAIEAELMRHVPELARGGFCMVPIVGSRQPMARTLISGLIDALRSLPQPTFAIGEHLEALQCLLEKAEGGASIPPVEIVRAAERTAELVQDEIPEILGLIIIYDELGKSLEHAALNPDNSDVGLLQMLAEAASRSISHPMGLITILHQAFEHYAAVLSSVQRREWEKVQGRFESITFLQSSGELLSLIDHAIQRVNTGEGLERAVRREAEKAEVLDILPKDLARDSALETLAGCAPLHPSVALTLGKLFRSRLAQNERSLFAFLGSGEPHGFQEYLHTETWNGNGYHPFYRLDRLYDYVHAALGSGLYVHAQGKRWAEIEEALERLPHDAEPLDAALVKTIGMLTLLGDQRYIKASRDVLTYALVDGHTTPDDVQAALRRLEELNIAIYRRFKDAYGLWQGSDIDLDECYERGQAHMEPVNLSEALRQYSDLKPYVAKRHLHETGTFRYYVPRVIDLEQLTALSELSPGEADGAIIFVLPPTDISLEEARQRVIAFSAELPCPARQQIFFAIPCHVQNIREELEELAAWRWVINNIVELEGDSIARLELRGRQTAARERLERALARSFALSSSYASSLWVHEGRAVKFASPRQLASALSDTCDQVFHATPIVKNELINRRSLSSAAAAARRALIERMLDHGTEERLGLQGYPPEVSIYLSVLHAGGLHHPEEGGPAFGPAEGDDTYRVKPLWEAIDTFLCGTEERAQPITDLYDVLSKPPFGIREGLLPIYVVAAMLHWDAELALYEEGTFVPRPGIAEYERLLRVPERFTVQRYPLGDARRRLLTGYARIFDPEVEPGQVSVLGSVRLLMGFAARLPRYTQLTDRLGEEAQAVRRALYTAKEPQALLFRLLPDALGFPSLDDDEAVDDYLQLFRPVLLELQNAYETLLEEIEVELLSSLRLPTDVATARQEIRHRAGIVQGYVSDMRLSAFLFRLRDKQLADREWIESVAAVLVNKPPRSWNDEDVKALRVAAADLSAQLRRVEEVALSRPSSPAEEPVLRLAITDASGQERRDLLRIRKEQGPELDKATEAMETAIRELGLDDEMTLAALTLLARKLLDHRAQSEEENHD